MYDLTKIFVEKQKEMQKLLAPASKTPDNHQNVEDIDSKAENVLPTTTSTPIKTETTMHKNIPIISGNIIFFKLPFLELGCMWEGSGTLEYVFTCLRDVFGHGMCQHVASDL